MKYFLFCWIPLIVLVSASCEQKEAKDIFSSEDRNETKNKKSHDFFTDLMLDPDIQFVGLQPNGRFVEEANPLFSQADQALTFTNRDGLTTTISSTSDNVRFSFTEEKLNVFVQVENFQNSAQLRIGSNRYNIVQVICGQIETQGFEGNQTVLYYKFALTDVGYREDYLREDSTQASRDVYTSVSMWSNSLEQQLAEVDQVQNPSYPRVFLRLTNPTFEEYAFLTMSQGRITFSKLNSSFRGIFEGVFREFGSPSSENRVTLHANGSLWCN